MNYLFLAEGFEEVEALTTVDVLRRAGLPIEMVSITADRAVASAHGVIIMADRTWAETDLADADFLLLPGGLPGSENLDKFEPLCEALLAHNAKGGHIGAICAAPMVLGRLGILAGRRATCYPGFETAFRDADYTASLVETDGTVITGCGPAAALPYSYAIVDAIMGEGASQGLREGMMYCKLMS